MFRFSPTILLFGMAVGAGAAYASTASRTNAEKEDDRVAKMIADGRNRFSAQSRNKKEWQEYNQFNTRSLRDDASRRLVLPQTAIDVKSNYRNFDTGLFNTEYQEAKGVADEMAVRGNVDTYASTASWNAPLRVTLAR